MGEIDPFAIFTPVRQLTFDDDTCSLQENIARRVKEAKSINRTKDKNNDESDRSVRRNKNESELREIVKSKDKQIQSLHSHVKVLESTI